MMVGRGCPSPFITYRRLGRRGWILVSSTTTRWATVPPAVAECSAVALGDRWGDTSTVTMLTPRKPEVCKDMAC